VNVRAALASAGLAGAVGVSTAVRMDVTTVSFLPSRGVFSAAARRHMPTVTRFLPDSRRATAVQHA
jgi:hypothetical protein